MGFKLKNSWKDIVMNVAPMLGTALGGPMAGAAVKVIAEEVLGDPNASESQVADFIATADPDALLKLKQADHDFKLKMEELGLELEEIRYKDRASAREMAKYNMWPQIILSSVYTVGYVYLLAAFLIGDVSVPTELKTEFNLVLGVLTAGMANIMQFWFGSSAGSKSKPVVVGSNV